MSAPAPTQRKQAPWTTPLALRSEHELPPVWRAGGEREGRCADKRGESTLVLSAIRFRLRDARGVPMAPVVRWSVLVLSSTRLSLCSLLTAAQASAASALGYVSAFVRAAALSLAAGLQYRRRLALAAC